MWEMKRLSKCMTGLIISDLLLDTVIYNMYMVNQRNVYMHTSILLLTASLCELAEHLNVDV